MKDIQCTICKHANICKWVNELMLVNDMLQEITVNVGSPLSVILNCKAFEKKSEIVKGEINE